jgi:hypothetical protein
MISEGLSKLSVGFFELGVVFKLLLSGHDFCSISDHEDVLLSTGKSDKGVKKVFVFH